MAPNPLSPTAESNFSLTSSQVHIACADAHSWPLTHSAYTAGNLLLSGSDMRAGVIVNKGAMSPTCLFTMYTYALLTAAWMTVKMWNHVHPLNVALELSDTQDYRYRGATLHLNTHETDPIRGWIHTRRWRKSQNSRQLLLAPVFKHDPVLSWNSIKQDRGKKITLNHLNPLLNILYLYPLRFFII